MIKLRPLLNESISNSQLSELEKCISTEYPQILLSGKNKGWQPKSKQEIINYFKSSNIGWHLALLQGNFKVNSSFLSNPRSKFPCKDLKSGSFCYFNSLTLQNEYPKKLKMCIGAAFIKSPDEIIKNVKDGYMIDHLGAYPHAFNEFNGKIIDVTYSHHNSDLIYVYWYLDNWESFDPKTDNKLMSYLDQKLKSLPFKLNF